MGTIAVIEDIVPKGGSGATQTTFVTLEDRRHHALSRSVTIVEVAAHRPTAADRKHEKTSPQ